MSFLGDLYLKKEKIELILKTMNAKNIDGISLTVAGSDKSNDYGQNLSAYVAQTKEERDEGKKKFYVGNGKIFWNDGKIINGKKSDQHVEKAEVIKDHDDLPF